MFAKILEKTYKHTEEQQTNHQIFITLCGLLYLYPMYSIGKGFYFLKDALKHLYDDREAAAIAHEVMEHITGLDKTGRLIHKELLLTSEQETKFNQSLLSLQKGVPMQYVTGTAWFMGNKYAVTPDVLIPRPETEELVQWIVNDQKEKGSVNAAVILEIGSGSGCIPISLKKKLPYSDITSCDISEGALKVATKNAEDLGAVVTFKHADFLNQEQWNEFDKYDIVVSNPPYIPVSEKEKLHINVRENEPATALFVPDDDALVFYRAIAHFGLNHLKEGGCIYCELDAAHAVETKELFEQTGYTIVTLKADMFNNLRMLKASR
jgi:release factor glutamine methyltransferase